MPKYAKDEWYPVYYETDEKGYWEIEIPNCPETEAYQVAFSLFSDACDMLRKKIEQHVNEQTSKD